MADTIRMPKLGFDMAEGTLVRWVKAEGESVSKSNVIAEIETDKATVEVESPFSGIMARHLVTKGAVVPVNTPIAVITAPGEKLEDKAPSDNNEKEKNSYNQRVPLPPAEKPLPVSAVISDRVKASPLARKMAGELGLELNNIPGTGPGGRVIKRDILLAKDAKPVEQYIPTIQAVSMPVNSAVMEDSHIPTDKLRARIGQRMVESKQTAPHFYITHEYRVDVLLSLRKELNALLPEDQKLSVNDFIVKATALALKRFPNLNASLMPGEIIQHAHINISVAVALESGLMTVVCKDADQKSLRSISQEIREMAARARSGKVRPEDIEASTFSISNLGMFDVEHFAAIINQPEAAILAVGSAREVPVVENGEVKVGTRMRITISADHRITDGAEAARFMQALADGLENPLKLLL